MKIYPCNNYSKLQKNWAGWWGYFDEWKPQYKDYNQTKVKQNYLQIIATCSFSSSLFQNKSVPNAERT